MLGASQAKRRRVKDLILDCRKWMVMGVAAMVVSAAPALAQDNSAVAAPATAIAPPPKVGTIGPGELSNFSLPGTVTHAADKPAAAPPLPPRATAPKTVAPRPEAATKVSAMTPPATSNSDLFRRPPSLPNSSDVASTAMAPPMIANPPPLTPPAESNGLSLWPWAIALLAIIGTGLLWFGRLRRGGQRTAVADNAIDIVLPPAAGPRPDPTPAAPIPSPAGSRRPLPTTLMPKPAPAAPAAPPIAPQPDPIIPGGIVSTGLRPWIDVELSPDRALLDEQGAAIAFELTLFNSGSAAARDVVVEAKLLNAGASQDVELSAFFTAEATLSDPIPQIAPYARIPLRSAVRLPREAISEYDYEGRKLFMPLVAISVRYRWSSGDGQSAAGFLVGQGAAGQEKLAPLRIDLGARSWNGLGARRYEKGVRR